MAAAGCPLQRVGLRLLADWVWQIEKERRQAHASAMVALRQDEDPRSREAESHARNLYAVAVGRAYDAWEKTSVEQARQILDDQRPRPG